MFLSFSLRDMPEISMLLRIDHYKQARNTFFPDIIPSMKTRAIEDLPFCEIFENSLKQQSPMKCKSLISFGLMRRGLPSLTNYVQISYISVATGILTKAAFRISTPR